MAKNKYLTLKKMWFLKVQQNAKNTPIANFMLCLIQEKASRKQVPLITMQSGISSWR